MNTCIESDHACQRCVVDFYSIERQFVLHLRQETVHLEGERENIQILDFKPPSIPKSTFR